MEERNINNQNERYIDIAKIKLYESVDQNDDYILPDYINEIKRLVRCETKAELINVFNQGNSTVCEGEVLYNFLCICEDNQIQNVIYSSPFNINLPYKENSYIYCKAENSNARLTGSRKVSLKCKINLYAQINEKISTDAEIKNIEQDDLYVKRDKVRSMFLENDTESNLHASHDIEISRNLPEIVNIVYCRVNSYINEIKKSDNKISLKGESILDLLYEGNNGEYINISEKLPLADIIENIYPDEEFCICKVNTKDVKASVTNNNFGEMRVIELDFGYDLNHSHYYNRNTEILNDAYCLSCETDYEKNKLEFNRFVEGFSTPLSINETLDIPEYEENLPYEIINCFAQNQSSDLILDSNRKKYIITGVLEVTVLTKCAENDKYSPNVFNIGYKYEKDRADTNIDLYEEHDISITAVSAEIEKGKVHINCELHISALIASKEKCNSITMISKNENQIPDFAPITLCYPEKGETLWDISKKYKCRGDDIIKF
ncbi:MAG: DUF3794 domain-containing protein, partial [Clostridia bacterium]|nr:DUF3794 domain-containing protein [Clostridia bacterium]